MHRPELAQETQSPAAVTGEVVEAHACRELPGAVLIDRADPNIDPFVETQRYLRDPDCSALFEAAVGDADLAVFVDVLQRTPEGGWELTEIKAATRVEDHHLDDVAVQALALQRAGVAVSRYWLMHINSQFVYRGGGDYAGLFAREDVTERVRAHVPFVEAGLARFKALVTGPEPVRHIGGHCKNPYPCPFKAHCEARDAPYPVACLPNGWQVAQKMIARGIYDIRDVPIDELSSEVHLWVRAVTRRGEPELLPGACEILEALDYPRYYLDFECIQFAIPIWEGTRPYAQLPFQWSCHIQDDPGTLAHEAFLDASGRDPRRAFAESLLDVCGEAGPIIVYHQAFERRIIAELAENFTDLRDRLLALNDRVFDLLPVVRQHYYHPDMKGSWSIKSVLPCLVPELDYAKLGAVREGTQAQAAYFDLIGGRLDAAQGEHLRRDLLDYCELDTLAMVKIVERLCRYDD